MKVMNRTFHREYQELEKFEAGIVLTGAEVKSTQAGGIRLDDAFVKLLDKGPQLINAEIMPYRFADNKNYDPRRSRKLLLNKKEILRLRVKLAGSGSLTLVPVACYNKHGLIKLEIALAKGRKDVEKRKLEKNRDIKRNQQREAKEYMKN